MMLQKDLIILECSRIFSLPMTILSWLVIFTYSLIDSGNIFYGFLCLVGLSFAHLATNLIDDYFDYKFLIKQVNFDKNEYLKNSQKTKCRYLINGLMKEVDIIKLIFLYLLIAFLIGLYLYIKCGQLVIVFALIGFIIAVLYPFLTRICLAEFAVALAYGPALFGGVSYVMCGNLSDEVFLLSIPTTIMTVILLYIHMVMDYEFDLAEGKKTISNRFNSQLDSLVVLKYLIIFAYLSLPILCVLDILDWQVFFVYLTIPMAKDLYKSLIEFSCNQESIPEHKWYHFPMENMKAFTERNEASFMTRIYQARNLMIYFSLLFTIAIILGS